MHNVRWLLSQLMDQNLCQRALAAALVTDDLHGAVLAQMREDIPQMYPEVVCSDAHANRRARATPRIIRALTS
jgi:hypothetical protein